MSYRNNNIYAYKILGIHVSAFNTVNQLLFKCDFCEVCKSLVVKNIFCHEQILVHVLIGCENGLVMNISCSKPDYLL